MDTTHWKWFRYDEIFEIKHGFYNKKPEDNPQGVIPFIGATDSNNGITSKCDYATIEQTSKTGDENNAPIEDKIFEANCITVSNNGSVGYAFYQPKQFTCTHDVNPLYLKGHLLTPNIALFLCTLIEKDRFRWAYGRKWRPVRMPKSRIKLPVTSSNNPDWEYIENYVKEFLIPNLPNQARQVWQKQYSLQPLNPTPLKLSDRKWKHIPCSNVFKEISIGKSYDLNSLEPDENGVEYLSRSVDNNGYEYKVSATDKTITKGNFISVVMVGIPSTAFYQPNDVICAQNILVLRYPQINQYNALFLCSVIQKECYRYSYGRTLSKGYFESHSIYLPVLPNTDTPDWQFMEDYIKSLPYSRNI